MGHSHRSGASSAHGAAQRRVGLSAWRENRLKAALRPRMPSEPWVEAQFVSACDVAEDGTPILYRYHDPHVFPPGGAETAMRRCRECGVLMPPHILSQGRCIDHADHTGWGPSPSAIAIRALQRFNLRLEVEELPAEDVVSLRQEIAEARHAMRKTQNRTKARKRRHTKD